MTTLSESVTLWLLTRGIRQGYSCWICDRCQRFSAGKWTRIEHDGDCPNRDVVRERYETIEGRR